MFTYQCHKVNEPTLLLGLWGFRMLLIHRVLGSKSVSDEKCTGNGRESMITDASIETCRYRSLVISKLILRFEWEVRI